MYKDVMGKSLQLNAKREGFAKKENAKPKTIKGCKQILTRGSMSLIIIA
jgi:hypothetical protein